MDSKSFIESGTLELYIAGLLSEKENLEIEALINENPEIKKEVEAIEASILALSKKASPGFKYDFKVIVNANKEEVKVIPLEEKNTTSIFMYIGWAASVLLAIGMFWIYQQNKELKNNIQLVEQENISLENQIANTGSDLEKTKVLLNTLRDKNISVTTLGGQKVSPASYAKAYWNKENKKLYIDAKGLPEPPDGFVYQVWSLKLSPLTPTSVGLLDDFDTDDNKIFTLDNPNNTEAFGITLEPSGGSESPNLEQLYTLGVVASS